MSSSYTLGEYARDLGISESPQYKASPRESIFERIRCLVDIERDAQELQSSHDSACRTVADVADLLELDTEKGYSDDDVFEAVREIVDLVDIFDKAERADEAEIDLLRTALLLVPAIVRNDLAAERPDLARCYLATDLLASSDEDEPEDTRDRDETDRHETSLASFGLER